MMKEFFRLANPVQPVRSKVPNDGPGPQGAPECYYTSRPNRATFRYVRFVNKLRAQEEEERKGRENANREFREKTECDFFIRCDRRSLIKNVEHRVELCLQAYEEDLQKKREKLISLLTLEEEQDIRKFVEQAQAGIEAAWKDKMDRLNYLLAKRKKEHEDKYKETPLSKCAHITPFLYTMRAKETQEIQLYQMKEKEAMAMAQKEVDKMWHEMAMKESEALTARMEYDAIERKRRDMECKMYSDQQMEELRQKREKEREYLKQEALYFKSLWEEDNLREEEAEQRRAEARARTGRERAECLRHAAALSEERARREAAAAATWDELAAAVRADQEEKAALMKRKEVDLVECNKVLKCQQEYLERREVATDKMIAEDAARIQRVADLKRCDAWRRCGADTKACAEVIQQQIKEKHENVLGKRKNAELAEYQRQLQTQTDRLVANKERMDAEDRKRYQNDLREQVKYNKLLKDRARQEELDQIRKAKQAAEDYENEIKQMLKRTSFSEQTHPFAKPMRAGLAMKEKCPCSKQDYCK